MTHHYSSTQLDLSGTGPSWITWARRPARKAVVFVHGFRGKPTSRTWGSFHSLLLSNRGLRGHDLVYYGYSSRRRVQNLAIGLREFLHDLVEDPMSVFARTHLPGTDARDATFSYGELVLVAHSLGALVCRAAMIDSLQKGQDWPRRTKLCLLAPAHTGADVIALSREALGRWPLVATSARVLYPCLTDLEPGSETLASVRERHEVASPSDRLEARAEGVLLGERDSVVSPNPFPGDPPADQLLSQGHLSVCKPRGSFLRPYEWVVMHV